MTKKGFTYKGIYIFFLIIYILSLPLGAMNIGSFGSLLKVIAILPVAIAFLFGGSIHFSRPLTMQAIFTFFALASILWSVSSDLSMSRALSYVLLFALIASGAVFSYDAEDIRKVKYALAWSSRLTAIVMFMFAEYINGRFTLKGIIQEDPNNLCAYFAFGVVYALGYLTDKNNPLPKKLLSVAELIIYLYLVLASGSRGGLIAIMSGAAVFLIFFKPDKKSYGIKRIAFISLLFVSIFMILEYLPQVLQIRFTLDDVVESGASNRIDIWRQTLDLFASGNLFRQAIGYGTATIVSCFRNFGYASKHVSHNIFLETLAELGVIGLFAYSAAIVSFIKYSFKERDKFAFAVIVCMFAASLSLSLYTFKPYFNIMLFIVMLQNVKTDDEESLKDDLIAD